MGKTLQATIDGVEPVRRKWRERAREHLDNLAIPPGSLGDLLDLAEQLAAVKQSLKPSVRKKTVVTMAGDHGVTGEGVSAFPREVTLQMVANFVAGGAAINVLAGVAGARVLVVDMGVAADLDNSIKEKILSCKVDYGTRNMAAGPAMTREQAVQSLETGIEIAGRLAGEGVELLATGDMGIGNTTPSSAILAAITGRSAREVTGRGTGVTGDDLENKIRVIQKALEVNNPDPKDPVDVLAKVGGFEIGGIAGLILGAAYHRVPVVVDGFISSAGALLAKSLAPASVDYMIAGHRSMESGHRYMLEELGLKPLLNLNLRLGEGTGAALAMNLVESAAQVINKMLTFEDAGVSRNTPGAPA
ncbi:nicotinate-nucleotide--dimethylbenzimidazole phosphoribosyltransferase [Desulfoscipio geothermicus]|uniref:Nicotinate-nucleotide--dimethylbenzimidazole phosphoribosyltransferase n=1 Tax=Desulfoscipio geothermicus DSM 3669 TaxID=1121426 RepID=A0A1I6CPG6_9FIRM|nr:nicotinate-nucleotide--dimethylbenzimidazole phosphoribosyltransferase [Desulfoscipio geothermicus]SFQ95049.1 nicotinate-nucleotide-dimethylbenzimidazole phosphoribosyltransferase [Desulfoscipio geothermicus DSM 3669]